MRRLVVFSFLAFLFWSAVPAGANTIPRIDLTCDAVTVGWIDFPTRPVDLVITLEQHARTYTRTVSTEGARSGETVIPANFSDGPASATVTWVLQKSHTVGPVEAVLHCTTTTTEPSTTTSTLPESTTVATPPPDQCGPDTLACTGSSSSAPLLFGFGAVALGAVFMALNRRGVR